MNFFEPCNPAPENHFNISAELKAANGRLLKTPNLRPEYKKLTTANCSFRQIVPSKLAELLQATDAKDYVIIDLRRDQEREEAGVMKNAIHVEIPIECNVFGQNFWEKYVAAVGGQQEAARTFGKKYVIFFCRQGLNRSPGAMPVYCFQAIQNPTWIREKQVVAFVKTGMDGMVDKKSGLKKYLVEPLKMEGAVKHTSCKGCDKPGCNIY